jgi:hypothetical protein
MRIDNALGAILVWVGLAMVVGLIARSLGRSAGMWVGLSILISPLLGGIALAAVELAKPARRP